MAFKSNGSIIVTNDRAFDNLANVTIQNSGNLTITSADTFQGTVAGYTSGGYGGPISNVIDKFPFATDTNATDVGDLTQGRTNVAGQSSASHGYTSGGFAPPTTNTIDKFPFAVNTNASDVGDLSQARTGGGNFGGQSSSTHGYTSGGIFNSATIYNTIDKFPFAVDTNATDVGDLTQIRGASSPQSSTTYGYASGGTTQFDPSEIYSNTIDRFPFASDTNASDVGDLTVARSSSAGQSSTTHGYVSGGRAPVLSNVIDKFPFATNTNATDIGDLSQARQYPVGQSSTLSGYSSGGGNPNSVNTIDKFPFASDTNATDVGDITVRRTASAGQQD